MLKYAYKAIKSAMNNVNIELVLVGWIFSVIRIFFRFSFASMAIDIVS